MLTDSQAPLPGIPAAPVAPPRTNQAERRVHMGYIPPKERRCCANCMHFDSYWLNPDSLAAREMPYCKPGNFPVLRGGICNEHTPKKAPKRA